MTDEKQIDHHGTDDIVCPWCGNHHDHTGLRLEGRGTVEWNCAECGKLFEIEPCYSVTYYTEKVER